MSKIRLFFYRIIAALSIVLHALPITAHAATTDWQALNPAKLRLITTAPDNEGTIKAVLEVTLDEGWHTYWAVPGDAGLPPRFNTEDSTNIKDLRVDFLAPTAFNEQGLITWGYKDHVQFPLTASIIDPAQNAALNVKFSFMVCKDICIPLTTTLVLDVPTEAKANTKTKTESEDTTHAAIIKKAFDALPHDKNLPGLKINNAVISKDAVVIGAFAAFGLQNTKIFAATGDGIALTNQPQLGVDEDDPRQGMIVIDKPDDIDDLNAHIAGGSLEILLTDGKQSVRQVIRVPGKI